MEQRGSLMQAYIYIYAHDAKRVNSHKIHKTSYTLFMLSWHNRRCGSVAIHLAS